MRVCEENSQLRRQLSEVEQEKDVWIQHAVDEARLKDKAEAELAAAREHVSKFCDWHETNATWDKTKSIYYDAKRHLAGPSSADKVLAVLEAAGTAIDTAVVYHESRVALILLQQYRAMKEAVRALREKG
jgi:hypothetical protein